MFTLFYLCLFVFRGLLIAPHWRPRLSSHLLAHAYRQPCARQRGRPGLLPNFPCASEKLRGNVLDTFCLPIVIPKVKFIAVFVALSDNTGKTRMKSCSICINKKSYNYASISYHDTKHRVRNSTCVSPNETVRYTQSNYTT